MATFVHAAPAGDEAGIVDPALDLARHIKALVGQDPASVDKITDQQALTLAMESLDDIFAKGEAEVVEGVVSVVCWVFQRVLENNTAPADSVTLVDKFIARLTSKPDAQPALRLKTLSTLYNVLGGNGAARYNTFQAIVKFAEAAGKQYFALVVERCEQLPAMLKEWGTDVARTRDLYLTIVAAMDKHGNGHGAQKYRTIYLSTFQGAKDVASAKKEAATAVVSAIADPTVFILDDLMDLDAIKALSGDGEHGKLYELFNIFASGSLNDFNKFHAANAAYTDKLGLKKEACVYKMRMLSLCTLACAQKTFKYAEAAECMHVSEGEVEQWMIKAMTAKLLDAKMDQSTNTVIVNNCKDRTFGAPQWQMLRSKLVEWRDSMKGLLAMVDATRQKQEMEARHVMMQMQQTGV
mmetsp:Transcript_31459/g.77123  ORF Transcript_31459/g.77123 Transcript_31459/m.77123 type:complete len:409 (+) Transcript_31459:39-1265(+)|eukprot:CAMPEP_0206246260 /NCGR_PEP_ID=MMETSP0047_2-20121206/19156_1 /ASSEMBLY_ACC=CAM_ASM_000192 /TAXON_ID=195065 /ORGANISM="Chroomonas mesostigmatica_cf, Strain CCMP1168" /LENGTH=408 /DNA_ID=CAMNT_0053671655 /DNA_START=39 /DNA_END=1265 /DNA_ORIENTATION=-